MLRGFVAVAQRLSITQAADDLCLTQSAVSKQVQVLEEFLGAPVLKRKYRGIELTELGQRLFALASPFFAELSEFALLARQSDAHRPVTITASIGVTALWILPRLGAFQTAHDNIDVRVAANDKMLDLRQEGIDLAIRYARPADVPANAMRLFGEKVVPVANKALVEKAATGDGALLDQVLLEFDERARPWLRWSDWLESMGLERRLPKAYLHFNQYDQVIQAAMEGHGVALGRVGLIMPMLKDRRLAIWPGLSPADSDYAFWLIIASDTPRLEVTALADWIRQEAATIAAGWES